MNKSTHFSGQPTFSQLIKLIPKELIHKAVGEHQSDRYYKKFTTWHHLTTMLFACFGNCNSLREVVTGMRALEGRLSSSGIKHLPTRSTFSEANQRRDCQVFEDIYLALKHHWDNVFPDSRKSLENYFIIDSTVITLFQEIFKGSGSSFSDGRRKGGLKVHMAVPINQQSPCVVHIGEGADNDLVFHKYLTLPSESTVIMDRGYRFYPQFNLWTQMKIRWITRLNDSTHYDITNIRLVNANQSKNGVQQDLEVVLGFPQAKTERVIARIIDYIDPITKKHLRFLTNDLKSQPFTIAQLYAKRWSIELLFKRLKQNMPLQFFLGDNKNAIKIQIWCALIADLLINVIRRQVKKKWAFSNIVSLIRLHLFNYLDLISFLEKPETASINQINPTFQLKINLSG
ncbi:IS4 family transposase [Microcoleus sp. F8-C3]